MALPFLAGLAAGALAVVAFNKRDKIREFAGAKLNEGKKAADKIYAKGLSAASAAGEFVSEKTQTLVKPKRKRRTPAQMAAARAEAEAQKNTKKSKKQSSKPKAKKAPAVSNAAAAAVTPIIANDQA